MLRTMAVFFLLSLLVSSLCLSQTSKARSPYAIETSLNRYYVPDHYPSYQEIVRVLNRVSAENPDICKLISIGKTHGWNPTTSSYDWQKDILVLKISDNPHLNESEEASVFIHWHHAREWICPAFMLYLIDKLVSEYQTNHTIHWIVNNFEIYIAPLTNADGYIVDGNGNLQNLSGTGPGGWRKNCRDNDGDGTFEITSLWGARGEGVDLERNWDWYWQNGDSNPQSLTYRGPSPFSEPETFAEKEFIINYDIDAQCVLHSFTAVILIPWFYASQECPHAEFFRDLAQHMALRTKIEGDPTKHFRYGRPDETIGYTAPGSSPDWVYGALNKIGIAIEFEPSTVSYLQDGFHPPVSKIMTYCSDVYEAVIYFIETADTKLKPKNESYNQPKAYIVWGYVKDAYGNPIPNVEVRITNPTNNDTISVMTDKNGFYMLNLGRLSNKYSTSTELLISAKDIVIRFTPDDPSGSERIDFTGILDSAVNPEIMLILLPLLLLLRRDERV